MTTDRALRLWFLALYAIDIVGFLSTVARVRRERPVFERQIGPLPETGALVAWLVPPVILLAGIGRLAIELPLVRAVGVALSLYALIVVAWTVRTLGRQLIPGLAILPDHVLITAGPYRWLRHPMYSGALALWLGAALGTLNWLLLAIWPLLAFGVRSELPKEEAMLRDKFGVQYEAYEARTGRLLPRLGGRRPSSPT
jgi:protein-S-isoprenylcysteine O-methyltransferase